MSTDESILAAELSAPDSIAIYSRSGRDTVPFSPWLLVEAPDDCARAGVTGIRDIASLKGGGAFRHMVRLQTWSGFQLAREQLAAEGIPHFAFANPIRQHLVLTGQTFFKGMRYESLHRLQLDIETLTLDPFDSGAAVILVALSDSRGYEEVLGGPGVSETDLLEATTQRIVERDPDVIEGHNIFRFDLHYLAERADNLGITLRWGRDGSALRLAQGRRSQRAGSRRRGSDAAYIHGRHIIDTYRQIQRFDVGGRLESYGLKEVVHALGLQREDRVFVPGDQIAAVWREDPQRLIDYALDDVRDVLELSRLISPTEFYQTQLLPYTLQETSLTGTGEKINSLMVGAYLRRGLAIPRPAVPRPFPGGYTRVFATGLFNRVVKADVQSLYPSIMLAGGIRPASDTEGAFLPLLKGLTRRRLDAKSQLREAESDRDRAYWDAVQSSYKILINSFYGYLGYGRANFSDYAAAEKVTTEGQQIAHRLVELLASRKAEIIEVDTDGVYFVLPVQVDTEKEEYRFIEAISEELPPGIDLSHDGRFKGMISLKAKNYVLLMEDGSLTIKGSSLRSRRDERLFRDFIKGIARLLIEGRQEEASEHYRETARRITEGDVPPQDLSRRETISEKTFSNPKLRRLAAAADGVSVGERISVYQRRDGSLAQVEHYDGDEDRDYLLRRLHDMASRFADLFEPEVFGRLFPQIHATDPRQLSLF